MQSDSGRTHLLIMVHIVFSIIIQGDCDLSMPYLPNQPTQCDNFINSKQSDGSGMSGLNVKQVFTFTTPGYPKHYQNNLECVKVIQAPVNKRIVLSFRSKFLLELQTHCSFDYLEIRNGPYGFSPMIGKYCKTIPPSQNIVSSGRYLWLRLHTDRRLGDKGFKAAYHFIDIDPVEYNSSFDCQIIVPLAVRQPQAVLQSQDFNVSRFKSNIDCSFDINVPYTHKVFLLFDQAKFDLSESDCDNNFFQVFDGFTSFVKDNLPEKVCRKSQLMMIPNLRKKNRTVLRISAKSSKHFPSLKIIVTAVLTGDCPNTYFECEQKICMSRSLLCNKVNNCIKMEDEKQCDAMGNPIVNSTDIFKENDNSEENVEVSYHAIILSVIGCFLLSLVLVCTTVTVRQRRKEKRILRELASLGDIQVLPSTCQKRQSPSVSAITKSAPEMTHLIERNDSYLFNSQIKAPGHLTFNTQLSTGTALLHHTHTEPDQIKLINNIGKPNGAVVMDQPDHSHTEKPSTPSSRNKISNNTPLLKEMDKSSHHRNKKNKPTSFEDAEKIGQKLAGQCQITSPPSINVTASKRHLQTAELSPLTMRHHNPGQDERHIIYDDSMFFLPPTPRGQDIHYNNTSGSIPHTCSSHAINQGHKISKQKPYRVTQRSQSNRAASSSVMRAQSCSTGFIQPSRSSEHIRWHHGTVAYTVDENGRKILLEDSLVPSCSTMCIPYDDFMSSDATQTFHHPACGSMPNMRNSPYAPEDDHHQIRRDFGSSFKHSPSFPMEDNVSMVEPECYLASSSLNHFSVESPTVGYFEYEA